MRNNFTLYKKHITYLFITFFVLILSSCGKLEKLSESDEFDFFNSDNDERELRRYTSESPDNPPLIQFVVDNNDLENIKTFNHIKKVCDYTKLGIKSVSLKEWNSSGQISESIRVLCIYDSKKINATTIEKIVDFVSKGGTLYLPYNSEDSRFSYLIGLKPEADLFIDVASAGIILKFQCYLAIKIKNSEKTLSSLVLKEIISRKI